MQLRIGLLKTASRSMMDKILALFQYNHPKNYLHILKTKHYIKESKQSIFLDSGNRLEIPQPPD